MHSYVIEIFSGNETISSQRKSWLRANSSQEILGPRQVQIFEGSQEVLSLNNRTKTEGPASKTEICCKHQVYCFGTCRHKRRTVSGFCNYVMDKKQFIPLMNFAESLGALLPLFSVCNCLVCFTYMFSYFIFRLWSFQLNLQSVIVVF